MFTWHRLPTQPRQLLTLLNQDGSKTSNNPGDKTISSKIVLTITKEAATNPHALCHMCVEGVGVLTIGGWLCILPATTLVV